MQAPVDALFTAWEDVDMVLLGHLSAAEAFFNELLMLVLFVRHDALLKLGDSRFLQLQIDPGLFGILAGFNGQWTSTNVNRYGMYIHDISPFLNV